MDVFELHRNLIADYASYTKSFIKIRDERIRRKVEEEISQGLLWPDPLLQLNPSFEPGAKISDLVREGLLHGECDRIFRLKQHDNDFGKPLHLHRHQEQAVRIASGPNSYVLTTGTGSGKSLAYIIPAVNHVLNAGTGRGIQAIVVYPMNALANSQKEELDKFLKRGFQGEQPPVTYARYTGQEGDEERARILNHPPDILLTNYVMLELILTRIDERRFVNNARNLRYLVFDELHTYRGRQGADVAMLIRRCRDHFESPIVRCVGTSATMVTDGTSTDQSTVVAAVATTIFGEEVKPEHVIGETLRRATQERDFTISAVRSTLADEVVSDSEPPSDFVSFCNTAMASWLENTFGLRREAATDRLIRQLPRAVHGDSGAAAELAKLTGTTAERAEAAIERFLFAGSRCAHPETGFPVFAFRLHQFITRGDTAWASLEDENAREITLRGQQFVPGDRNRVLLPLVFCRSCGQPYYRVARSTSNRSAAIVPRETFAPPDSDDLEPGYLYLSSEFPWTDQREDVLNRVPDDWIEIHRGEPRVKRGMPVPELMRLGTDGVPSANGIEVAFVSPFRFCLNPKCGVSYNARQKSDLTKLGTIGVDGRSTATTVLALATILKLRVDQSLQHEARKLLSFTDNRQDASLQAGHFNDFVEVGLIRSALFRAMSRAGKNGLRYDELVHHVERAIDLPVDLYANDAELRGPALEETRRALRAILTYYLYRDLERGWRVTSPNLEQCGLLQIEYLGLDELAADQIFWQEQKAHGLLVTATPAQRKHIIRVLLDHLRRSLAVKEDSLTSDYQDRISEQSRQRLREPWVIEDSRDMIRGGIAWPRIRHEKDRQEDICVSPQSNFGQFLRRPEVLPVPAGNRLTLDDTGNVILDLFRCLRPWGLVEEARSPREGSLVPGYQLPASIMIWKPGEGTTPLVDALRVTREPELDNAANEYFVRFYRSFADMGAGLEAREHTAQVHAEDRVEREVRFRTADLPILFCSPTMELGVDIAQLNVVNMRNVPPTPANYSQRSGRAGRSGQPALVYTYCSGFSPHDQYYFRNPNRMVSGAVNASRIDLLNRDLVKAHIHAVWLAEAQLKLGQTLTDVLTVTEDDPALPIKPEVREKLNDASIRLKALQRAKRLLQSVGPELRDASWYRDEWLEDVLSRIPQSFEEACHRWRSLYRAAVQQRQAQNRIIGDHSRSQDDRDRAKRLRAQAESQMALLTDAQRAFEADFYSYRYFASEGFLPGYSFPRLPLSAFIPARRGRRGRDEFLSRPRFLAISEFGPQAMVYHEGARYRIHKVNLAFDEDSRDLTQFTMKFCSNCGYGHMVSEGPGPDTCESCCQALLPTDEIRDMVRLQNVTAKRADRITSDEEERQRIGYEIANTFRFAEINGSPDFRKAEILAGGNKVATMRYGDAVTIWRINKGWKKRANPNEYGFVLDIERGYWASNKALADHDHDDPLSSHVKRVVPYVEDRRNAIALEFDVRYDLPVMATMQAALKQGIQKVYQLEPDELAADGLPGPDDRRLLFLYEAAEGGAGVLRQLAEDPEAMAEVARAALEICHFDPETGNDLAAAPDSKIKCEAACYDCLLEYGNQPDHRRIDRKLVLPVLQQLARSTTESSGGQRPRVDHLDGLMRLCDSQLERRWLQLVHDSHLRLPSDGQYLVPAQFAKPDFFYREANTVIFIDGPVHDTPEQQAADRQITDRLTAAGYLVVRFHHAADWNARLDEYPDIFGRRTRS